MSPSMIKVRMAVFPVAAPLLPAWNSIVLKDAVPLNLMMRLTEFDVMVQYECTRTTNFRLRQLTLIVPYTDFFLAKRSSTTGPMSQR